MLQGIWKYYHYSPKAVRELKELAESMQVKAYKSVKADGTLKESSGYSSFEELLHGSNPFTAQSTSKRCKCNNARQSI